MKLQKGKLVHISARDYLIFIKKRKESSTFLFTKVFICANLIFLYIIYWLHIKLF